MTFTTAVGTIVTKQALVKAYDRFVLQVLSEKLQEQSRKKKGERTTVKILDLLPGPGEYKTMRDAKYSYTAEDLVENAKSTVENLQGEMESWRDNMSGTNFESSSKYEEVSEAADTLQNIHDSLDNISVDHWPETKAVCFPMQHRNRFPSRADQLAEAIYELQTAAEILEQLIAPEGHYHYIAMGYLHVTIKCTGPWYSRPAPQISPAPIPAFGLLKVSQEDKDQWQGVKDEIENAISEAEGVSFPGMY